MATPKKNKPTPAQIARFRQLRQQHPDWSRAQVIAAVEQEFAPRGPTAPAAPVVGDLPVAPADVARTRPIASGEPNLPGTVGVAGRRLAPPREWGVVNALLNGVFLGGQDELAGTIDAFRSGTSVSDEITRQQRGRADFLRKRPVLSRAAEAVGAVGSLAGPLEAHVGRLILKEAPSLLRRLAVPAGLGTGTGLVVGALDAPTGQRVEGAIGGGLAGGVTGATLGLAGPVWRGLRNVAGMPSADAAERLALGDMAAAGTDLAQMRARAEALAPNEPATVGEMIAAGPRSPSTGTQRSAYQVHGEGQAATGRGLGAVEGSVLERVGETIQDVSGVSRQNVSQRLQAMQTQIDDAAEQAYGLALDRRGIVSDKSVNSVLNNAYVRKYVIPEANKILEARGMPVIPEQGAPSARQLQILKGAMDDRINYKAPQEMGGLSRTEQSALRNLRGELNSAMERTIPGYREANQQIAPMIRQRERFIEGADFGTISADELAANWQKWSQGEREAYRQGAINAELQALEEAGQTAGGLDKTAVVNSRFTSTAQRRKWRLLLGRDASQVQGYVERALERSAGNRSILGGSSTASNLIGLARIGEEAAAANAAGNVARGNVLGAFKDIFESGTNRMRGITPRTAQQISDLYTAGIETGPTLAGLPNREALLAGFDRLGLAAERQGRAAGSQAAQTARVAQILAQLIGGGLTEAQYARPETR